MIYVTDKNSTEYGYYYMYGTNAASLGYYAYKSKDLENWSQAGLVFKPTDGMLTQGDFYAPEVIYDKDTDQYYMFYSGKGKDSTGKVSGINYLCVATSKEPYGPFAPCTESGLTVNEPLLDTSKVPNISGAWNCIDASPFIGADGEKYLLFCRVEDPGCHKKSNGEYADSVWGMRMKSWSEPDYTTLTRLTMPGYRTVDRSEKAEYEWQNGTITERNEAPHMYVSRKNGKVTYHLTFSINGTADYAVIQAVGDSPLGSYKKLTKNEGGILLAEEELNWDHIQGPGHHCFIQAGNELFIFYHEQVSRDKVQEGEAVWKRFVAKDRVLLTENGNGQAVLVVNGPTWSLQPKVEAYAKYHNIASQATVKVDNGWNEKALTDGILSIQNYGYNGFQLVDEYMFWSVPAGQQASAAYKNQSAKATITLDFGEYREITGLMIYNSRSYNDAFQEIERIEFDYTDETHLQGATAYIEQLPFDMESYANTSKKMMRPGGSAVATFAPMKVKQIRITIKTGDTKPGYEPYYGMVKLSAIVVLGK